MRSNNSSQLLFRFRFLLLPVSDLKKSNRNLVKLSILFVSVFDVEKLFHGALEIPHFEVDSRVG